VITAARKLCSSLAIGRLIMSRDRSRVITSQIRAGRADVYHPDHSLFEREEVAPPFNVLSRAGEQLFLSSHRGDGEFGQVVVVSTDNVDARSSTTVLKDQGWTTA
jgi:hypothetical protein